MVNTEIRLIIFSAAKDGEALYSQQKQDRDLTVAQMVKHLSTMRETQVQFLGWDNPLEKEMAIHSRTIAWKIPGTEEAGRLQPMGSQRIGHD